MSKKEITVFLSPVDVADMKNGRPFVVNATRCSHHVLEAKLVMPEKKIEITESQFDDAIRKFFKPTEGNPRSPMQDGVKMQEHLREVLFGGN